MKTEMQGRARQRSRTRKQILQAAGRLLRRDGPAPSFEAIADEAEVSRATAYRYFPGLDALLAEAALDMAMPDPETLFAPDGPVDPVARVEYLDYQIDEMMRGNERALRAMLASTVMRRADGESEVPPRQNRRLPLIRVALAPLEGRADPTALRLAAQALAMIVGTEGMIVLKDVLGLDHAEARRVKHWAIKALVEAASREA